RPLPKGDTCEPCSRQPTKLISSGLETNPHDRSYAGILPFLMPSGGEPQGGKASERRLANLVDPGRSLDSSVLLKPLKVREIILQLLRDFNHRAGFLL